MNKSSLRFRAHVPEPLESSWQERVPHSGLIVGFNKERAAASGLVILIVYVALKGVFGASYKPFWHDEMCTLAMARLPSVAVLWGALEHAADSHPPGFYLIERMVSRLVSDEQIAFRVPSIIGFCCVVFCSFVLIRRRSGSACALLCSAMLLLTTLPGLALEARPYSLLVASISVAMVCYQRAPVGRWMFLMGLSFAVSQGLHHYAALAFVPFIFAEVAVSLKIRRLRLAVWLALGCGLLPLLMFWPMLSELKRHYGLHLWWRPTLLETAQMYAMFFQLPGIALFAGAGVCLLDILVFPKARYLQRITYARRVPFQEYVVALGFVSLPILGFAVAKLAHVGMIPRYLATTVLGVPLVASYILSQLERRSVVLFTIFISLAIVFHETSFWSSHIGRLAHRKSPARELENLLDGAGVADIPVVISNTLEYMPIVHYARPEVKKRLFVLLDARKALAHTGTDNVEVQLSILRSYIPLQAYETSVFMSRHQTFLLYSSCNQRFDWLPSELRQRYALQLVAGDHANALYFANLQSNLP